MNSLFSKIVLLLLIASMVLSFAACKDEGENKPEETQPTNQVIEDDKYQKDSIPDEIDYNGQEVKILYPTDRVSEFAPEVAGNVVEQVIIERNLMVEDRIGVVLSFIPTTGGWSKTGESPFKATVEQDILGGGTYDICADYGMTIGSCIINDLTTDLKQYDILDFNAPWWASDLNTSATINNKLFFGTGDISTSYISSMYCMFVNKDLHLSLGLDDPYEMVDMDNWKWEFFIQLCKETGADLDDVQGKSKGDRFGIVLSHAVGEAVFYSGGCQFMEMDTDETITLSSGMSDARASDFYDLTQSFFSDTADAYVNEKEWEEIFLTGNSVFAVSQLKFAQTIVSSDIEMDFGVLPMPKYDDNQTYRSGCWVGRSLYFISAGSHNKEIAATTMECMASEGYRQVTHVLYDETYKLRYSSDAKSAAMIDIIRDSMVFDLAQVYTYSFENQLPTRLPRGLVLGEASGGDLTNLASVMGQYQSMMNLAIKNITKSYE